MADGKLRALERAVAADGGPDDELAWLREHVRQGSTLLVTHAACDGNDSCKREPTGRIVWQWYGGDYCRLALAAYCNYKPAHLLVPHPDAGEGKTGWECLDDERGYPADRWLEVLLFHAKDWPREVLLRAAVASARAVIEELCDPASAVHRPSHIIDGARNALDCVDAFLADPTEEKREVWRLANMRANIGTSVDWLPYASKGGNPRDSDPNTIRAAIVQAGDKRVAAMACAALLKWCLYGR